MKGYLLMIMTTTLVLQGCKNQTGQSDWVVDKFDDIKVLRYEVPGFEELTLDEKLYLYYLSQAALCGRDILFDQNFKYNLLTRRTLEAMYKEYKGDRSSPEWVNLEKYLKKVWFANGVHHHYSGDKFVPDFSQKYFTDVMNDIPEESLPSDFGSKEEIAKMVSKVIFDPSYAPRRINQVHGEDMIKTSANNYYEGVTQAEVEAYYNNMVDHKDSTPISYGLNSQLAKVNGKIVERTWRVGGMYSKALEQIVYWMEKASSVASAQQKSMIASLVEYYRKGNLRDFDKFNVAWVKDTVSRVDFVNGFTETYGDPLGYKASWEALVNFKDINATKRTEAISAEAQWFEDNSPIDEQYKKREVKGVSAKVITAAMLGGDCYPATPIGINLPNADWIRKEHGSKSVTIQNITYAYDQAAKGNGFTEEFFLRAEDRDLLSQYGSLVDNLHTDLHECLGHGSGQLAPGVKGGELKNFGSALEETRADLFALYYLADKKLVDLGILPSSDAYKAEYIKYLTNGMMTQLTRIQLGKDVEQAHMRNRKLISEWVYERSKEDKAVEIVVKDNKRYVVINNFERVRELFGELLKEVQRIKSEGDYAAGKELVERYAIKIDADLHKEILERYAKLNIEPYSGFVNPKYTPIIEDGKVVDVKIEYVKDYPQQMMEYSTNFSLLPTIN